MRDERRGCHGVTVYNRSKGTLNKHPRRAIWLLPGHDYQLLFFLDCEKSGAFTTSKSFLSRRMQDSLLTSDSSPSTLKMRSAMRPRTLRHDSDDSRQLQQRTWHLSDPRQHDVSRTWQKRHVPVGGEASEGQREGNDPRMLRHGSDDSRQLRQRTWHLSDPRQHDVRQDLAEEASPSGG